MQKFSGVNMNGQQWVGRLAGKVQACQEGGGRGVQNRGNGSNWVADGCCKLMRWPSQAGEILSSNHMPTVILVKQSGLTEFNKCSQHAAYTD